jgi:hypothetical protein
MTSAPFLSALTRQNFLSKIFQRLIRYGLRLAAGHKPKIW